MMETTWKTIETTLEELKSKPEALIEQKELIEEILVVINSLKKGRCKMTSLLQEVKVSESLNTESKYLKLSRKYYAGKKGRVIKTSSSCKYVLFDDGNIIPFYHKHLEG